MKDINQMKSGENQKVKDINLKEIFLVIKRRFWVIALVTVLAIILGVYLNKSTITPLYQTSSRIIISEEGELQKTLQVIIRDSTILDKVIKELNLDKSAEELAGQIAVASIETSQVVSISVVETDPVLASKIADTTARVFKGEVPKIVGEDNVKLLSSAKVNRYPINQDNKNKMFLAIIGGLVIGVGLAFLLESMDDRIRSEKEIESLLGVQVLGRVSKMNKRNLKRKKNGQSDIELRGETVGFK